MRRVIRFVAALQLALILPAALFMIAVLVADGDTPQYDLARVARQIVTWFAARGWTLWVLLLALPVAVLAAGCATLGRSWNYDVELPRTARHSLATIPAPVATLVVAGTTFVSLGIVATAVLHMLAN